MSNTAIYGTYNSSQNLENALDRLTAAGFPDNSISVLFPESSSCGEEGVLPELSSLPAGMETLALAGFDPALAAGTLLSAGIANDEVTRYERSLASGNIVLLIHIDGPNSLSTAKFILEDTGALEVASCSEQAGQYAKR